VKRVKSARMMDGTVVTLLSKANGRGSDEPDGAPPRLDVGPEWYRGQHLRSKIRSLAGLFLDIQLDSTAFSSCCLSEMDSLVINL